MLGLRSYLPADAKAVASWVRDEDTFRMWSAYRYEQYPLSAEDINDNYSRCIEEGIFFPYMAFDESGVVGHMIMRWTDEVHLTLRFGFIIVDDAQRGKGYGKALLRLALRYAEHRYKPERITLGVFEDNLPARRCYEAVGFRENGETELVRDRWRVLEMEYAVGQPSAEVKYITQFSAEMLAPCGLNCTLCRSALLKDTPCHGCRGPQQFKSHYCTEICQIWKCEKLSQTDGFCDRCPDYPCPELQGLQERYATKYPLKESPAQNLIDMREGGVETCVNAQRQRWRCPRCGGIVCVHTGECSSCGYAPDPESF